ncbi:MAG: SPASM domain-containing protein [Planctomycetes bacterium]|nr:SPASM domain-containing protein [Planctomycetota bacterium]
MFHLVKRVPLLARAFLAYRRGASLCTYPPLHLWIDPTDVCNLDCIMCPTQRPGVRPKGFMDFDLFCKIIDEAQAGFPIVNLYMSGESLIHKQIFQMMDYAAGHHAATCLYTNATLLDEEKAGRLLDSRLDWLGFSFDGYEKTTYETIRRKARYEKTLAHIEGFLRMKRERRLRRPHTYLSLIEIPGLSRETSPETKRAFRKRLLDLGLDQFDVAEPHNWAGQVNEFVQVQVHPPQAGDAANRKDVLRGRTYTLCPAPWTVLAVLWDGVVVPCCLDTAARYPLGNARESSITEIFNNERMQNLRRALAAGDAGQIELCRNCSVLQDRQYLGVPRKVWLELRDNLKANLPRLR